MDNFVLSSGFKTCQLVELCSKNPIVTYFYQLECQICKIEAMAGVSNGIVVILL